MQAGGVAVVIRIGGGTNAAGPNPGEAHFDNLNGGTPSGTWCPASRLNDDFGDGALARMWAGSYSAGGATLQETGGEAVLTPPPGVPSSSVGLVGAYGYDLTGDAIAFEVTEMLTPERGAAAFVEVSAGLGNALRIQKVGSELAYMQGAGGVFTPRKSEPFDPVRHRWWRIREIGWHHVLGDLGRRAHLGRRQQRHQLHLVAPGSDRNLRQHVFAGREPRPPAHRQRQPHALRVP